MAVKRSALSGALKASKQSTPKPKGTRTTLPLDAIRDRPHGDTRSLNPEHVEELAENIAAVGLIQPLAVDSQGHLLAGGHRRAALQLLEHSKPEQFIELFPGGEVPVRVFDFNATDVPEQAIVIEAAENEKRRDYTPAEVRALADKLIAAGYRNTKGKPQKGQKAIKPALAAIIGKSEKTVQRYLQADKGTDVPLSKGDMEQRNRDKLIKLLERFELAERTSPAEVEAAAVLRGLMLEGDK